MLVFTILAVAGYVFRRRRWFSQPRPVGFGFWSMTMFFYFCIVMAIGCGWAPYYVANDRGFLQSFSSVLDVGLLVLAFPRLPPALPPPIPTQ